MLRLELLRVKADLERELEDFVLNCGKRVARSLLVQIGAWPRRSRRPAPSADEFKGEAAPFAPFDTLRNLAVSGGSGDLWSYRSRHSPVVLGRVPRAVGAGPRGNLLDTQAFRKEASLT